MDLISVRINVSNLFQDVLRAFPSELSELIGKQSYLAGGAFKSLVLDQPPNDWDFWFRTADAASRFKELVDKTEKLKACYLTNFDNFKMANVLIKTENAYTFNFPKNKIQFVFTEVGNPKEVVSRFDYTHTMCYFDPISNEMSCPTQFIINKELRFNPRTTAPLSAMKRAFRFVGEGWTMGDKEVEALAKAISGVEWAKPEVVAKQKKELYLKKKATTLDEYEGEPGRTVAGQQAPEAPIGYYTGRATTVPQGTYELALAMPDDIARTMPDDMPDEEFFVHVLE